MPVVLRKAAGNTTTPPATDSCSIEKSTVLSSMHLATPSTEYCPRTKFCPKSVKRPRFAATLSIMCSLSFFCHTQLMLCMFRGRSTTPSTRWPWSVCPWNLQFMPHVVDIHDILPPGGEVVVAHLGVRAEGPRGQLLNIITMYNVTMHSAQSRCHNDMT